MTEHSPPTSPLRSAAAPHALAPKKWRDPDRTAAGAPRAWTLLGSPERPGAETLWFNTGTLCNIACENCYIESSPTNDRLAYLTLEDVRPFLAEIDALGWATREIGFTGGEPFLNPEMIAILEAALESGRRVLTLTNAMRPMMRPRIREGLLRLRARFGDQLVLRVSLDHHTAELHDLERGPGAFEAALKGLRWLAAHGFHLHAVGRARFQAMAAEDEAAARDGFRRLFAAQGVPIDADDPTAMMIFPEMEAAADPPEISTACWNILGKSPSEVMCASSRMVVKRRGAARPVVLACTLLPYDAAFELGESLAQADAPVALNHPHCATFCVLGGARCSR